MTSFAHQVAAAVERRKLRPGSIIGYVIEEVRRQGHDVTRVDGLQRISWMLEAWLYATRKAGEPVSMLAVQNLGVLVEPGKNRDGFRTCNMRVGLRAVPTEPDDIHSRITRLLEAENTLLPLDFYREFEFIHPFIDGNGRVGKILLNWKNGTLDDPIFPPDDFWGEKTVNP